MTDKGPPPLLRLGSADMLRLMRWLCANPEIAAEFAIEVQRWNREPRSDPAPQQPPATGHSLS